MGECVGEMDDEDVDDVVEEEGLRGRRDDQYDCSYCMVIRYLWI